MKITDKVHIPSGETVTDYHARKGSQGRAIGKDKAVGVGVDHIDINRGKALHEALDPQEIAKARQARVDELKAKIQSGEYNPSSRDVAAALVAQLHEYSAVFGGQNGSGSGDDDEESSTEE